MLCCVVFATCNRSAWSRILLLCCLNHAPPNIAYEHDMPRPTCDRSQSLFSQQTSGKHQQPPRVLASRITMSDQHASSSVDETAPLLPSAHTAEGGQDATTPAKDAWQRAFNLTTITAIVSGVLTLIFLVASIIVMSGRPYNYYPSFDLYYYFAPTAGFVRVLPPSQDDFAIRFVSPFTYIASVYHRHPAFHHHSAGDQGRDCAPAGFRRHSS